MTLSGAVRALDRYLTEHPRASLDSAITPGAMPQTESYTAGAVLCGFIYDSTNSIWVETFRSAADIAN